MSEFDISRKHGVLEPISIKAVTLPLHVPIAQAILTVHPTSVALARHKIPEWIAQYQTGEIRVKDAPAIGPEVWPNYRDAVVLWTSEAVTNAVRYGVPESMAWRGFPISLGVIKEPTDRTKKSICEGNIVVVVGDHNLFLGQKLQDPEAESSRGTDTMRATAKQTGYVIGANIGVVNSKSTLFVAKAFWGQFGPPENVTDDM